MEGRGGSDPLREALFLFALQNAVRYKSLPRPGAVIGMVMGKYPEFRGRAKDASALVEEVIAEVSSLSPAQREETLRELAPDLAEGLSRPREHSRGLPPLEGAEKGVVMRFAPNPSGPLHLGHARAAILNDAYVRQYGGKYILRIEDTDPKRIDPAAYAMVREDAEWLGLAISDIVYQSDRLEIYYAHARRLIEIGGAYVCTCEPARFKELKMAGRPCPCRDLSPEEHLEAFEMMLSGEFGEGEATVRVKTDLAHPDPAMRDFPAIRILKSPPHPRKDAFVYPLMNFSVAVDDHLLGITHVIRGKDHIANTRRQRYIFEYFGWEQPVYRHYGRMGIEGVVLSTSQMREGIAAGAYSGWDDIRLGTLRAIARRGITPEAVRQAIIEIGIGETDISFSWENLYAHNRDVVDPVANRYFFVPDPLEVTVEGAPRQTARALLHPTHPERGSRELRFEGTALVPRRELPEGGGMVRLKDLFNVEVIGEPGGPRFSYAGDSLADARRKKAPIIQWLPPADAIHCTLVTPQGPVEGACERRVSAEVGRVVQFERVCFARVDAAGKEGIVAYFAHR
ncbi:MAG: glutamate--tRNA ligase [Methanolinea sp.]|nr:glutamate--tRNA ligase [Methanolinea sp.]